MVGGHYTYAKVPLGFWIKGLLDLARIPMTVLDILRKVSYRP
jgi:uncharacterized membrane protein YjdF